jgi:hypothetical protein
VQVSGLGGAAMMAAASNLEQRFTHRPDSYIPGHTLAHLLELRDANRGRWSRNMTMHYASGATAGVIRRRHVVRGPPWSLRVAAAREHPGRF